MNTLKQDDKNPRHFYMGVPVAVPGENPIKVVEAG